MSRLRPHVASIAGAALVLAAMASAAASCGSPTALQLCGEIPQAGCPVGRGGSCDDVSCAALYDCVDGDWTEVEACPGGSSGQGGGGGAGAGGGDGAGGCELPDLDWSGEAEGCTPDLLEPDCPAVAAEVCPDPCATGCVDFYLCTEDGWIDVAVCDEGGTLRITR